MRVRALMATASTLVCLSGCFVWEELDEGEKTLTHHSRQAAASEAPAEREESPSSAASRPDPVRARGEGWWRTARSLGAREEDSDLIRCRIGPSTTFMRSADCRARGGRALD
jgi:hypothetical protein